MCSDELSRACEKVGRFLHDFALVEREIDKGIIAILDLNGDAAEVISQKIDFAKKVTLLQTIAIETAPAEEKEEVGRIFKAVWGQNDNRKLLAHTPFEPAKDEAVQFWRTVAKEGRFSDDPIWTKPQFEQASVKLKGLCERLTQLQPRFEYSVDDEGRVKALAHYLYSPASTWVPPWD